MRGFFNKSWGSMPQTPLPALGTYRTRIHAFCQSKKLTLTLKLVATTLSIGWNYFRCVKVCQVHNDPPPRPSMASRLLRSHENISCFKYCPHTPPPPPPTWNPGCAPAVLSLQCQTFGIQIRLDVLFGLIWVQPISKDYYFAGLTTGIIPNSWPRILFD